ncbi:MAG: hypothetical protein ACJAUD_000107 [Crocinitomicaceae bacterium]|jgi:hypothetical protein
MLAGQEFLLKDAQEVHARLVEKTIPIGIHLQLKRLE